MERRITAQYLEAGYVLSFAKLIPQKITDGVVTIQITEGYIDNVAVVGDSRAIRQDIEKISDFVQTSRPLHMLTLERYLQDARQMAGVVLKSELLPVPFPMD